MLLYKEGDKFWGSVKWLVACRDMCCKIWSLPTRDSADRPKPSIS